MYVDWVWLPSSSGMIGKVSGEVCPRSSSKLCKSRESIESHRKTEWEKWMNGYSMLPDISESNIVSNQLMQILHCKFSLCCENFVIPRLIRFTNRVSRAEVQLVGGDFLNLFGFHQNFGADVKGMCKCLKSSTRASRSFLWHFPNLIRVIWHSCMCGISSFH